MKRLLILSGIVVSGVAAIVVAQQGPPPGAPAGAPIFSPVSAIEKITDNLYRIPGGGGNSAVWVRGDGVLLVDTKLANNGQTMLDLIKTVTDKPVTHIINTHTHGDHTGSNAFFPAQVEIVTQENTRDNMQKMEAFKTAEGKVGLPDRTFKDKLTLFQGKEAVDLYYFGRGHTSGDAFVVFRSARAMHSGDIFAGKRELLIDTAYGGSGIEVVQTLDKAAKGIRNVDKVITGHADVMAWQDFVDYGEFNRLVLEHARKSLAAGKTPEQAMVDFQQQLPAKFRSYNLSGGRGGPAGNFTTLYAELQPKS